MARSKATAAEECCAKCESDIAALKREITALKKELAKKSAGGGVDPRLDKLISYFKQNPNVKRKMEEAGI
tara:strand:+ start:322 stop:531 length:210 start_codon:yes stop_codon:yes gene_type:complete